MKNILKIVIAILFVFLSACGSESEENSSNNLSKYLNKDVDKIKILNGQNGEQVVITNANEINEIVQYLEEISVSHTKEQDIKGYSFKVDLINGEKTVNSITFFDVILKIDDQYYESENEINTNVLKNLMKN